MKDTFQSIMGWNAMRQGQKSSQPAQAFPGKDGHLGPIVGSADDRADGDHDHIHEQVFLLPPAPTRVSQRRKITEYSKRWHGSSRLCWPSWEALEPTRLPMPFTRIDPATGCGNHCSTSSSFLFCSVCLPLHHPLASSSYPDYQNVKMGCVCPATTPIAPGRYAL